MLYFSIFVYVRYNEASELSVNLDMTAAYGCFSALVSIITFLLCVCVRACICCRKSVKTFAKFVNLMEIGQSGYTHRYG